MQMRLQHEEIYLYALSLLKGIGPRTLVEITRAVPDLQELPHLSADGLRQRLGSSAQQLLPHLPIQWQSLLAHAEEELLRHLEQGILPIALTSDLYPPLLKRIPDPPPLLYAKGNLALLRNPHAVAIVGTREPTPGGLAVAKQVAYELAQRGYTVVSGLAKGIDGAAHEGALDAQGKTIAVFGTPLDTIYPAAHRALAERILAQAGLLVSELALGQRGFKTAFVRRDRIQSGLSLAVLPIQTRNDGGTMHTVKFAREQHHLIICPRPLPSEAQALQYEGIWTLLQESNEHVHSFTMQKVNYGKLIALMQQKRYELLPDYQEEQERQETTLFPLEEPELAPSSQPTTTSARRVATRKQKRQKQVPADTPPSPLLSAALPLSRRRRPAVRGQPEQPFPPPQDTHQSSFWS